jgi:hypothetical protein
MILPRVNVHVDQWGRPLAQQRTVKLSLKGALDRLLGPSRSRLCSDRRRYNRKLRVLCRKYAMFGKLRSMLTVFCSKMVGLLFVNRQYRFQGPRGMRRMATRARPEAAAHEEVVDNGGLFSVDLNSRNEITQLYRDIMREVTDGVVRGRRARRRGAELEDLLGTNAAPDNGGQRDTASRLVREVRAKINGMIPQNDPRQRIPGTLFHNFINQLAQEMAIELENMLQRGVIEDCYMVPRFMTVTNGDRGLAKQMAEVFCSKRAEPEIENGNESVQVGRCVWRQEHIDCVVAEHAHWFGLVGEDPRDENIAEEDDVLDIAENIAEDDAMDVAEEDDVARRGNRLRRITRSSVKRHTAACLDMMIRWLPAIEAANEVIEERRRVMDERRRNNEEIPAQEAALNTTPIKVFNLCPQAHIEIKSAPMTASMWRGQQTGGRGLLGWVFGDKKVSNALRAPRGVWPRELPPFTSGRRRRYTLEAFHRSDGVSMSLSFVCHEPGDLPDGGREVFWMTRRTKRFIALKNLGISPLEYPRLERMLQQGKLVRIAFDMGRVCLLNGTAGHVDLPTGNAVDGRPGDGTADESAVDDTSTGVQSDSDVVASSGAPNDRDDESDDGATSRARPRPRLGENDDVHSHGVGDESDGGAGGDGPDEADGDEGGGNRRGPISKIKSYHLPRGQFYEKSGANRRIHHGKKMCQGVQDALDDLSLTPSKTADPARYVQHVRTFATHFGALFDAFHDRKRAKLAFRGHGLRMKVVDDFMNETINDVKRRHLELHPHVRPDDLEVLVVVGLPTFASTGRGERAVPTLWLAEHIARRWQTLFVDEGLTTKVCPDCLQDTKAATMAPLHHPRLNKVVRRLNKNCRTLDARARELSGLLGRAGDLSPEELHRVRKLEEQILEGEERVGMLVGERVEKERMLEAQNQPMPNRVGLASMRFCKTCMGLGLPRPRKNRDVSAALNILALGEALLAGLPRPAPFCDIKEVRSAGQRMQLVELLLEPSDGIDRTRYRPKIRRWMDMPWPGEEEHDSVARWAKDVARRFLLNAVTWVHIKDQEVEDVVNYAERRALLRQRKEEAVPYARQANAVLKWLLGERLGVGDMQTVEESILGPLAERGLNQPTPSDVQPHTMTNETSQSVLGH